MHGAKSIQLCLTLCDPMVCSPPGPLSMRFPRQEYWSELPFPTPGDLPNPGTEPGSLALQADSLLSEPPEKPLKSRISPQIKENKKLLELPQCI